jgi:ABC-type amino acid transport substrate-binding protein
MKSLTLRSSVALACALSLAACGGSSGTLLLGGNIYGLTKDGLVLQNNGGTPYVVPANTVPFSFPELVGNDQDYNVTVKSSPASAVCTVANGKGKTGAFNIITVVVNCITNTYPLTGQITGLDKDGLVLINGKDRVTVPAGANTFALSPVGDGSPYGVTVLTQPDGRTCSVQQGVGTMGAAPVNNVQVSCV